MRRFERPSIAVSLIALAGVVAHVATIGRYGVFRDELYYVACGEHLAWGYVDHPPLVAALAWIATHVFGGSLPALRVLPILCGALTVLVTASLVRRLGGGRWAQAAAALCVTIAPHYLFVFHTLSMNAPEILLFTLAARILVEALEPGARWAWLGFGVVVGLAALNKITGAFWGVALFAGVLLGSRRVALRSAWPWAGALVAVFLFHPFLVWQHHNDWPMLEFVRNAQENKILALSPVQFLREQVEMMHPLAAPVWILGLIWGVRRWRRSGAAPDAAVVAFVVAWSVLLVIFLVQRSKAYYLTPAYPPLLALGAIALERWRHRAAGAVRVAAPALWVAGGIALAPFVLPVLTPEDFVRYSTALGQSPASAERHEMGDLPQHFADMHGWEEMARTVSRVYVALPAEERATARFYGQNYGEAGAVDYFRRRYPLPPAVSGHNAYWTWGPGAQPMGTVLVLGGDPADHARVFVEVDSVGWHDAAHAMPYERRLVVWRCREARMSLADVWRETRHYN